MITTKEAVSTMTDFVNNFSHDNKEFCELTHCTPEIATMFTHISLYDVILTRKEIATERKRLERMKHDTLQ